MSLCETDHLSRQANADPLGFDAPTRDEWVKSGPVLTADQKPAGEDQRDELHQ